MSQSVRDSLADAETLRRNMPGGGFWRTLHETPVSSIVYRWRYSFMHYRDAQRAIQAMAHAAFRACPDLRG